ncbi:MAG: hypothetical protein PVH12_05930 [Candidatus Bathyarchaeota archaeon]|jgi:hypothetical protein
MEFSVQEVTKNRGETLLLISNLILYVLVLLSRTVIPFAFAMLTPSDTAYDPGGPWMIILFFFALAAFIYFIIGVAGSLLVFKYKRNKLVYALAMICWAIETIFFSFLAAVIFIQLHLDEIIVGVIKIRLYFNLLLYLSIVILKVASITYFATKKVRHAFGYTGARLST